jgi:hypothetical protein
MFTAALVLALASYSFVDDTGVGFFVPGVGGVFIEFSHADS